MNKQTVIRYLEERAADFYALSDKIWENAEIRFGETKSAADYAAFLEAEGFEVTLGLAGLKTAFRGQWGSGKPSSAEVITPLTTTFSCEYADTATDRKTAMAASNLAIGILPDDLSDRYRNIKLFKQSPAASPTAVPPTV